MEAMMNTSVTYHLYTQADADEMSRLLGEVFAHRDPPAVAVGLTANEFETLVRLYGPKADAEGLTVVARSAATGEMIGALLAEDSASVPPDGCEQLSPKFNPIFDILGQLDKEYSGGRVRRPGESLHLFLLGVAQGFAGRGIAQRLVAECLAHGGRKGYRVAVTEATNKTSQHVFRRQGFIERVQRSYNDHLFEGQAYFSSIADQGGPMLMDRPIAL
ncbi:MAG: GNAT family N-acetyltransferase [Acidobacteria bacterium]|nr:MAG: GNAT family N-acetyltransferase [Acidobacteriota bacterium]